MLAYFRQLLRRPEHDDPGERLKRQVLHWVPIGTLALMVVFLAVAVPLVIVRKAEGVVLCAFLILANVAAVHLLRRGRATLSALTFVSAHWVVATLTTTLSGGIDSPMIVYLYSLVVLTSWMLGRRVAFLAAGVVIAQYLILAVLAAYQIRPPRYFPAPPLAIWAILVVSIAIASISLSQYVGALGQALELLTAKVKALTNAEQALRESEENLRTIFELAPDGIFILSADGRFREVNAAVCRQLGHSPEALRLRTLTELVAGPFRDAVRDLLAAGGGSMECSLRQDDGGELPVEIQVGSIRFAGEGAVIGTSRDTSERKRAELEKQKLEEQLRQAQKLESIGRLAGGVAHDFNNLLTVINGYSSLLLKGSDLRPPVRGQVEQVKKAGERAADLTRQLLAFGRKQDVRPEPLDLNAVIHDMERMVERLLGENIRIDVNLTNDLWHVVADHAQVQQVIMNLVANGRDSMPNGGTLTIETQNVLLGETNPGDYVLLTVSDTGTGIGPEILPHIFEPFFTTKERGKGTGLGLATVYGIVQQSGGLVRVESEPGKGTVLKIYFPTVNTPLVVREEAPKVWTTRGSETILVAEDNEAVRALVQTALEGEGYQVLCASSGIEALVLEAQHSGPIHLLLTDVIMPGMNGTDLAQNLTARRPGLKVLYASGYTDNMIAKAGGLGPDAECMAKPFTPEVVLLRVREVLGFALSE